MASRRLNDNLMAVPAFLGYLGVAVSGYFDTDPPKRLWIVILLLLFGLVYFPPMFRLKHQRINHLLFAIDTALIAAMLYLRPGWSQFPILFFLLSPQALIWFPVRTGLAWVGVFVLVTAGDFFIAQGFKGLTSFLPYSAGFIFFAVFGWVSLQAIRDRKRSEQLLAELQEAHSQLQDYASRVEELTIAQERNRIAREMHDTLGHRLTIASVQLEGAQRLIPSNPERAAQILSTVREQVREGLGELRRTVAMLRASVEEDLPLPQALQKLAGQVQEATGVQVHLNLAGCPEDLPAPYRQALFRAAQEGLTNVQRHAQASDAWLSLDERDGQVTLLVSDNGIGFPAHEEGAGFGLTGLKERSALLGGDFFVDPRPGGGTQLTFRLPLSGDARENAGKEAREDDCHD